MGDVVSDIGDMVSDAWDTVVTVASVIPGPWQAPALIYKGIDALSDGNIIGAGMAAYGFGGTGGFGDLGGGFADPGFSDPLGGWGGGDAGGLSGLPGYEGGGDFFGNDFGVYEGVDSSLGDMFSGDYFANVDNSFGNILSDNYTQGANEFVNEWGNNPLLSQEGVSSVNNMSQGMGQFPTSGTNVPTAGDGISTSALSQDQVGALSGQTVDPLSQTNFSPDATGVPTGGAPQQTPTLENITRDYGSNVSDGSGGFKANPNTGTYTPDYGNMQDADSAVDFAKADGAQGYGMSPTGSAPGMDTLGSTNKLQSYMNTIKGGGMGIRDMLTTPIGGKQGGLFQAPTPLGMAGKGLSALFDVRQGQQANDFMKNRMSMADNWQDPNRARGDTANQLWQQNFQDPMAGYNNFMGGAGRQFRDQAVAKMAAGGNRRQMGGKLQSDLASMYLQNQNQRGNALQQGFSAGQNNFAAGNQMAPQVASGIRNKYAPVGQALANIDRQQSLYDLFGND